MFEKPRAYSVATGVVRRLDRSLRNLSNTLVAVLLSLLIGCNCLAATSRADFASDAIRELYLLCQPKTAFFCENIHIGCAGRSKLATQSFYLETVRSGSVVQFKDGTRWTDETTRSLEAEQTEILLRNGQDWIRLVAKSSKVASGDKPFDFSQRIYRKGKALMTYGSCEMRPKVDASNSGFAPPSPCQTRTDSKAPHRRCLIPQVQPKMDIQSWLSSEHVAGIAALGGSIRNDRF